MNRLINWQAGSSDPNNDKNLAIIQQWWTGLDGKDVSLLVQEEQEDMRLTSNIVSQTPQHFTVENPRMEYDKLYWRKLGVVTEFSVKAKQLNLDRQNKQLKIVCQELAERIYDFKVIN